MKMKGIFNKSNKLFSNTGNSKQHFKTKFGPEIFKSEVYNALDFPILLSGSEIWTLRKKRIKTIDISPDESFQKNSRVHTS